LAGERALLVQSRPKTSVLDFDVAEIKRFLAMRLQGRGVEAAYLFGSVADGTAGPWSDLDVLIVKRTDTAFLDRALEFLDLFDLGLPVDILVYTPEELEAQLQSGSGFWATFAHQARRIV